MSVRAYLATLRLLKLFVRPAIITGVQNGHRLSQGGDIRSGDLRDALRYL